MRLFLASFGGELALVGREEDFEVVDAVFLEFFPIGVFGASGFGAALFFGEFFPGWEADLAHEAAVGEADDEFVPEAIFAEFFVDRVVEGAGFLFGFDFEALLDFVVVEESAVGCVFVGEGEDFFVEFAEGGLSDVSTWVFGLGGNEIGKKNHLEEELEFVFGEADVVGVFHACRWVGDLEVQGCSRSHLM